MADKVEEAREFLKTIGMPKAQQTDLCCYVILAMAGIKPDMSWSEAKTCINLYLDYSVKTSKKGKEILISDLEIPPMEQENILVG